MENEWPTLTNIVVIFCLCISILFDYFRRSELEQRLDYLLKIYRKSEGTRDYHKNEIKRLKELLKSYGYKIK